MIGYFEAAARSKKNGMFPRYNTRDSITNSMFYEKGIPGYICNFHENGKKMVTVNNEKNITTYSNSWDADGNDVTADTFFQ